MTQQAGSQSLYEILMSHYEALRDQGKGRTKEGLSVLAEALAAAPRGIKAQMDAEIEKMFGPMPVADHCDGEGNPCYTLAQIEKMFGRKLSKEEQTANIGVHRLQ